MSTPVAGNRLVLAGAVLYLLEWVAIIAAGVGVPVGATPSAHAVTPAYAGHGNASVWSGAVLRGDTEPIRIGRGSNVQDNSVIHADKGFPTTLGENVTVSWAAEHGFALDASQDAEAGAELVDDRG